MEINRIFPTPVMQADIHFWLTFNERTPSNYP